MAVVSRLLGHADPGFTLRVYVHALPSDLPDGDALAAAVELGALCYSSPPKAVTMKRPRGSASPAWSDGAGGLGVVEGGIGAGDH